MKLKVFHEDEWREYPAKTYAEYTYEWLGEPHESASIKLDSSGNEVARNVWPDSSFEGGGIIGFGTYISSRLSVESVQHPDAPHGNRVARLKAASPPFQNTNAHGVNLLSNTTTEPTWFAVAGTMQLDHPDARISTQLRYRENGSYRYQTWRAFTGDAWQSELIGVFEIPANVDDVIVSFYLNDKSGGITSIPPANAAAHIDMMHAVFADSEDAALAQVEHYFDGGTPPSRAWVDFQPRNISGVERIWPRSSTPPPPGVHYAWLGEPHASVSVRLDGDGDEVRSTQLVGPLRVEGDDSISISYAIPEGAENLSWRVQFRTTSPRDDESGGYHMTFRGLDDQVGRALRFPDDGEWHEAGQSSRRLEDGATEGEVNFRTISITSDWYELRNFQIVFDDAPWPENWDGSTPSDRAHDLWYNSDGIPYEWVNGQGWVAS